MKKILIIGLLLVTIIFPGCRDSSYSDGKETSLVPPSTDTPVGATPAPTSIP